jgi:hypothetical protein
MIINFIINNNFVSMKNSIVIKLLFVFIIQLGVLNFTSAQYKTYKLNDRGDTINAVDKNDQKVGKWVTEIPELRGEPGMVEEGMYKKGQKDGYWRKYNTMGDLLAVEHYILGGKDGLQQYFTYLGDLEREENWRGYNPDAPYDTVAIYGTGSGEIVDYKIVKAEPYSVRDGEWRYFEPGTGKVIRVENWDRNNLVRPNAPKAPASDKPKKIEKTPEMLQWEYKNRNKKGALRDGRTSG